MAMEVCRLRPVTSLTINQIRGLVGTTNTSRPILSCVSVRIMGFSRDAHTLNINGNMQYISNDKVKFKLDLSTMKINQSLEKPLCIMMNFMNATPRAVQKYSNLYLTRGFDVVPVSCTPWQLMWPAKGSQVVADQLLRFLEVNKCGCDHPLVLHGFSVGAYVWGELLAHTTKDKARYQPVLDRFGAQVWDSAADIHEIPVGFPSAVFPKNKFLQESFRGYIKYHMKTFHDAATTHYIRSSQLFHTSLCRAPALFLLSRNDPVGAERSNRSVHDSWVEMGIKCTWKCWDKSPHVQHFMHHPKEYAAALNSHLDGVGLVSQPEEMRMRL